MKVKLSEVYSVEDDLTRYRVECDPGFWLLAGGEEYFVRSYNNPIEAHELFERLVKAKGKAHRCSLLKEVEV
jgi:hypothetical protein